MALILVLIAPGILPVPAVATVVLLVAIVPVIVLVPPPPVSRRPDGDVLLAYPEFAYVAYYVSGPISPYPEEREAPV